MCVGSPRGSVLGIGKSQPSPYANNYGYGAESKFDEGERQWYIANGFGDPLKKVDSGQSTWTGQYRPGMGGPRNNMPMRNKVYAPVQYYQGVSAEARYLYTTAAERAKSIQDASAQYAQEKANTSNVRVRDQGVTYNYAGNALAIPGA